MARLQLAQAFLDIFSGKIICQFNTVNGQHGYIISN